MNWFITEIYNLGLPFSQANIFTTLELLTTASQVAPIQPAKLEIVTVLQSSNIHQSSFGYITLITFVTGQCGGPEWLKKETESGFAPKMQSSGYQVTKPEEFNSSKLFFN